MGPSVTLRARASTRTGPPGDIGTGAGGGYLYLAGASGVKSTFVGSIGGGRFCSFNGQVFSSSGIASSTKIFPVGISSASLCTRTFDSRILPLVPNHKKKQGDLPSITVKRSHFSIPHRHKALLPLQPLLIQPPCNSGNQLLVRR
jgi:hypothetical protein